jgi:hypothetical protein
MFKGRKSWAGRRDGCRQMSGLDESVAQRSTGDGKDALGAHRARYRDA